MIVGAPQRTGPNNTVNAGIAFIYALLEGQWYLSFGGGILEAIPYAQDAKFGTSVGISGARAIVGSSNHRVTPFFFNGSSWIASPAPGLTETGADGLGASVAVSGDWAIAGAPLDQGQGAAYIYRSTNSEFGVQTTKEFKLVASDGATGDDFGRSVAISGDIAIVGAPGDDDRGGASGSAYIFRRNANGTWTESKKLRRLDGTSADYFGNAVAIDGSRAIVGAPYDDDQADASGTCTVVYTTQPAPPTAVAASDGTLENRVQIRWRDASNGEAGFLIRRDGAQIGTTDADIETYNDLTAEPGKTYNYEVSAFSPLSSYESSRVSDYGWRPSNGSISGSIKASGGGSVVGASVRLEPPPGRSLLLDGAGGHVTIPDDGTFHFGKNDNFTLEMWFRYSGHDRAPRLGAAPATTTTVSARWMMRRDHCVIVRSAR